MSIPNVVALHCLYVPATDKTHQKCACSSYDVCVKDHTFSRQVSLCTSKRLCEKWRTPFFGAFVDEVLGVSVS